MIYELSEQKSHTQFAKFLERLVNDKQERETYFDKLIAAGIDLDIDIFRDYFEQMNAERKTNKQDYTPTAVANLMAKLIGTADEPTIFDGAAGSGTLIIAAWLEAGRSGDVFAIEFADNVLPMLLLNLAIRDIAGTVIHGDTLSGEIFHSFKLASTGKYSEVIKLDTD